MANVKLDYSSFPMTTTTANTTYVLDANQYRYLASGYLVDVAATQGLEFKLNGSLYAGGSLFKYGTNGQIAPSIDISVGKTGYLQSDNSGFSLYADGSTFANAGSIFSEAGTAVYIVGDGSTISNSGTIFGVSNYAVELNGADVRLENSGHIAGRVWLGSVAQSGATLVNSGQIDAASIAVSTSYGGDTVINSGLIRNEIRMYDGDDRFIDQGGRVTGAIQGGAGDDLYVIRSGTFDLRESTGGGFDTVKTSVSWTLDQDFEVGRLTGKKNIDLSADFGDTFLYGNVGKNKITGGTGSDTIDGQRGDDVLTGRGGSDFFVFKAGTGHDAIVDFEDGSDKIDLQNYGGVDGFGDLKIKQDGDDVVIELKNGDVITVRDFSKADLSDADFMF
jgi:Ca2+-binding RTX toxin-like protein